MKSHKQFEKFGRAIIAEYQKKLLLDRHHIALVPFDCNYMETTFGPPYLDIEIRYNHDKIARAWKHKQFDDLKHALVHELFHVLTDFFYDKAALRYVTKEELNSVRETLVDHLAMIVRKNGV